MAENIIIDGVDVSGCKHALQGKHTILCAGSEDRALCDANKNCLYKKYKRKEQECEKLKIQLMQKSEVDTFFNTPIEGWDNDPCKICEYKQNYQAKGQECEKLKTQILLLQTMEIEELKNYKQSLAEIKEIAEKQCNICEALTPIDEYKDCQKCWQGVILQKISEVIPND